MHTSDQTTSPQEAVNEWQAGGVIILVRVVKVKIGQFFSIYGILHLTTCNYKKTFKDNIF